MPDAPKWNNWYIKNSLCNNILNSKRANVCYCTFDNIYIIYVNNFGEYVII